MSEPDPARWKPVRVRLVKQADGSISGEMISTFTEGSEFRSWVRGWHRDERTGDILCEMQEHPDPQWEAWVARQDALARGG